MSLRTGPGIVASCLLCTTGPLFYWTHSSYDSMHKIGTWFGASENVQVVNGCWSWGKDSSVVLCLILAWPQGLDLTWLGWQQNEENTNTRRQTDRQRRWGWVEWALWWRNLRTLEAQNICFMQLNKKARILSTPKQGGKHITHNETRNLHYYIQINKG